jgi:hypothetical protein
MFLGRKAIKKSVSNIRLIVEESIESIKLIKMNEESKSDHFKKKIEYL